jgi:hypothetical protein
MTQINRLTANVSVNPDDSFPLWSVEAGRTRRVTGQTLIEYITQENIVSAEINDEGHLILTLKNGDQIDAGELPKADGDMLKSTYDKDSSGIVDTVEAISTGVVRGFDISQTGAAEITMQPGHGVIIDDTAPDSNIAYHIDRATPTVQTVDISTDGVFSIQVDMNGDFVFFSDGEEPSTVYRDYLQVGFYEVINGVMTRAESSRVNINQPYSQFLDFLFALGPTRIEGIALQPNGDNLSVNVTGGKMIWRGGGDKVGSRLQNNLPIESRVVAELLPLQGTNGNIGEPTTVIDPTVYDLNGVLTTVPQNDWQIIYFYQVPVASGGLFYMYGQETFHNLADLLAVEGNEEIQLPNIFAKESLLVGRIAVKKNCLALNDDTTTVKFLSGAKFGSGLAGGGSGGSGGGGDVLGAASSEVNEVLISADESGKALKTSGVTVAGEQLFNSSGKNISRLKTSTVRLYRSTLFNLPGGSSLGGVNFDGFENAVSDGENITPNLSGSIYGVPYNGLYRVTIEFWIQRASGSVSSYVDVMMNRAGFSDISDRSNVVGTRVAFNNNQIPQKVTLTRTIRLTTAQTMQLRVGNNFDPITILCSGENPLTVSYDRIDD